MGDSSLWTEFGLPGAAIVALATVLVQAFKYFERIQERHRDERLEWKKSDNEIQAKTVAAIKEITSEQTSTLRDVRTDLQTLSENVLKKIDDTK